jgi:hypothetical protein
MNLPFEYWKRRLAVYSKKSNYVLTTAAAAVVLT